MTSVQYINDCLRSRHQLWFNVSHLKEELGSRKTPSFLLIIGKSITNHDICEKPQVKIFCRSKVTVISLNFDDVILGQHSEIASNFLFISIQIKKTRLPIAHVFFINYPKIWYVCVSRDKKTMMMSKYGQF